MVSKIWASRPSPAVRRHRATYRHTASWHPRKRGAKIKTDALRAVVESMTNHERSLWGKQKCPGLRDAMRRWRESGWRE